MLYLIRKKYWPP